MDESPDVVLQWPEANTRCQDIFLSQFPWLPNEAVIGVMAEMKMAFDHAALNGGFSVRRMHKTLTNALWPVVVTLDLQRKMLSFINGICGNRNDAEEIYQDVCMKVFPKLLTWHDESQDSDFEAWFYRCSRNEATDSYRRRKAKKRYMPNDIVQVPEDKVKDHREPGLAKDTETPAGWRVLPERMPESIGNTGEACDHRERNPAEEAATQELIWRVRSELVSSTLTPEQKQLGHLLLSEATTNEIADALDIQGTSRLSNVNNKLQRLFAKMRQLIEIE